MDDNLPKKYMPKNMFAKGDKRPRKQKGDVNILTRSVKEVFKIAFDDLQGDPKHNLIAWAKTNPTAFYNLCSKLIPQAVDVKSNGETIKQIFLIGGREIEI